MPATFSEMEEGRDSEALRGCAMQTVAHSKTRVAATLRGLVGLASFFIEFSSRIQVVKIQNHVPHQRIASRSLSAPEGIIREKNHMSAIERRVNRRRVLRDFVST